MIVVDDLFESSLLKAVVRSAMKFEAARRDANTYSLNIDETVHAHPFLNDIYIVTSRRGSGTQSLAEISGKSIVLTESISSGFVLAVANIFMLNNHAGIYWPSRHRPSFTQDNMDSQHLWWYNIANTACENPTRTCLRATKNIHKRVWMVSGSTIHPTGCHGQEVSWGIQ